MTKTVHIRAREVLNDIQAGMDRTGLMRKYVLSERGIQSLFDKLAKQGLLERSDSNSRETAKRKQPVNRGNGAKERDTALVEASLKGRLTAVRALLDQGADVNAKGSNGSTALMMACWWGHLEVARLLLDRGANVNAKSPEGYTALMEACRFGRLEVAKLLLKRGANVHTRTDCGKTARTFAQERGHLNLQSLLLKHGAVN
jgi:ankyrin repeat protein